MKKYALSRLLDPAVIRRARARGGWPRPRMLCLADTMDEDDVDLRGEVMPEPEGRPSWRELAELEPRLLVLAKKALEMGPGGPGFCANAVWYGYRGHRGIKPVLSELVGWGAAIYAPPLLKTSRAYDVAYETIYQALPDCKHEGLIC